MTLANHRAKCIEAQARAEFDDDPQWDRFPQEWRDKKLAKAARVFDSLYGIAFVDPIEATDEMIEAYRATPHNSSPAVRFHAVAARGNLTNPPEQ